MLAKFPLTTGYLLLFVFHIHHTIGFSVSSPNLIRFRKVADSRICCSHERPVGWTKLRASLGPATEEKPVVESEENSILSVKEPTRSKDFFSSLAQQWSQGDDLYGKVKSYGPAGILSIIIVGGLFWAIYIPIIMVTYHEATGEWMSPGLLLFPVGATKVAVAALGFWSLAKALFPWRMAVSLLITPWVKEKIVDPVAAPRFKQ